MGVYLFFQIVSAYEYGADKEDIKSLLRDIGEELQQIAGAGLALPHCVRLIEV